MQHSLKETKKAVGVLMDQNQIKSICKAHLQSALHKIKASQRGVERKKH